MLEDQVLVLTSISALVWQSINLPGLKPLLTGKSLPVGRRLVGYTDLNI